MSREGLLRFGSFGNALPVTNPSYGSPPYYMRGYENLSVSFASEYNVAAEFLPAPLVFADEVPTVNISVRRIPFSTFGAAMEASISYDVRYQGKLWKYYPCYYVGAYGGENETGMLMGREYYGNAKKAARIEMSFENNVLVGRVFRPGCVPLFTITMSPRENVEAPRESETNQVNLRYIPGLKAGQGPDICQLVGQTCLSQPVIDSDGLTDVWTGPASLTFDSHSAEEPWHRHPVHRILRASYGRYHNYVPHGFVLHDYLAE